MRSLSLFLDQKSHSAKFNACGIMRQEKGVREGSFGVPTLWEWDGENSGRFCLKELYSYESGERIGRKWICSLRYHLKRGRGGYKLADVSHKYREGQAHRTFSKFHPNSITQSAWQRVKDVFTGRSGC